MKVSKQHSIRSNPSVRKLSVYNSYEALDQFLGNRDERKIANNTTAVRLEALGPEEGRAIAIILHHTKIVTFYEYGGVTLNSGGYRTVTTKQRMRQFLPLGWHMDRDWSLHGRSPDNESLDLTFYDGIGVPTREGFPPRQESGGKLRENPAGQLWYPGGVAIGRYKMGEAGTRYYVIPVESTVGWDFPTLVHMFPDNLRPDGLALADARLGYEHSGQQGYRLFKVRVAGKWSRPLPLRTSLTAIPGVV